MYTTTHNSCSGAIAADSPSDLALPSNSVSGYQLYSTGSEPPVGPLNDTLSSGVTKYITNGAGVNVPSESLGFYFGGLSSLDGGQPVVGGLPAQTVNVTADSLIQVAMSSAQSASWSNITLPVGVRSRANAQLVWLPISSQGILVVIGGVIDQADLAYGGSLTFSQTTDSQSLSPTFMTSLPVYDIENQQWHFQNTTGRAPGQLTDFCSVVAQATGSSSFEIYIYGGYDGLSGSSLGDVWILSIPSFTWVHGFDPKGDQTHLRSSHSCVKPYPDQMFVIGGESVGGTSLTGHDTECFNQIVDVFNLTTLTWLDGYDPTIWANYSVPPVVANAISAAPTATSIDPIIATLLGVPYKKNITTYYPYTPLPTPSPKPWSKWLPAVLGAVLGAVGLAAIICVIWWFRRRKRRDSVTTGTQVDGGIDTWIGGVRKPNASVTTTELEEPASPPLAGYYEVPGDWRYRHTRPPQVGVPLVEAEVTPRLGTSRRSVHAEADGTERYEMHGLDRSSPRSAHAEADGGERYEMHALERGSPDAPAEMATSYHFRDHALYPRNPAGASETMSPTHGARSTTSGDASAPSPYIVARRSIGTDDIISQHASNSPPLSSPDQSPPLPSALEHRPSHQRNLSSMSSGIAMSSLPTSNPDLDAIEAVSGLGYSASRPRHTRNISSLSSGIVQLPSPLAGPDPAEAGHQRSPLLSDLPSSPVPAPTPELESRASERTVQDRRTDAESEPLVSHQTRQHVTETRSARKSVARKQVPGRSAFTEGAMDSSEAVPPPPRTS